MSGWDSPQLELTPPPQMQQAASQEDWDDLARARERARSPTLIEQALSAPTCQEVQDAAALALHEDLAAARALDAQFAAFPEGRAPTWAHAQNTGDVPALAYSASDVLCPSRACERMDIFPADHAWSAPSSSDLGRRPLPDASRVLLSGSSSPANSSIQSPVLDPEPSQNLPPQWGAAVPPEEFHHHEDLRSAEYIMVDPDGTESHCSKHNLSYTASFAQEEGSERAEPPCSSAAEDPQPDTPTQRAGQAARRLQHLATGLATVQIADAAAAEGVAGGGGSAVIRVHSLSGEQEVVREQDLQGTLGMQPADRQCQPARAVAEATQAVGSASTPSSHTLQGDCCLSGCLQEDPPHQSTPGPSGLLGHAKDALGSAAYRAEVLAKEAALIAIPVAGEALLAVHSAGSSVAHALTHVGDTCSHHHPYPVHQDYPHPGSSPSLLEVATAKAACRMGQAALPMETRASLRESDKLTTKLPVTDGNHSNDSFSFTPIGAGSVTTSATLTGSDGSSLVPSHASGGGVVLDTLHS